MNETRTKTIWSRLKKRNVLKVALTYSVVAAILLLAGGPVSRWLGMNGWSTKLAAGMVILGLPIALALSWFYEITPWGLRRNSAGHIESTNQGEDDETNAPSIAVLPFKDTSEQGDKGYFCEGLAEEILTALSRYTQLRVTSRAMSFQFGSDRAGFEEIGRKLKAQTFLSGSVDKSGDQLRVQAQLVNTGAGAVLWSSEYAGLLDDIFDIHDDIVNSVARILGVTIDSDYHVIRHPVNPKAYDFFLRGLSYFARHTTQDNVYARQMFKQAIEIEPEYGRAWSNVAYSHGIEYMYFNASNINLAEAARASERALELAPNLTSSHISSGIVCCMNRDYRKAQAEFENAIRLNPKKFEAWYFFGRTKVHEGDLERALKLFERASRLRPEDFQSVLLQAQLFISRNQKSKAIEVTLEGIKRVRAALELNSSNNRALNMGAFALLRLGEAQEAEQWMTRSLENAPMDSIIQYNGACFYSLVGEAERALDCLENCLIKVGNINREWLMHDSDMDNIRNHPRFAEIIRTFPD
ncbi:MAG: tetratricopeptide repeat protein [Xanthomonadales bacterium]|nr:tetratricopeptide repeat protein [Xanthomonadales bacterium]